ncbi:hypothetical protein BaRGS_00030073, partial [Batillaria attramentaria]
MDNRLLFLTVALMGTFFPVIRGFEWEASSPEDGTTIHACIGGTVSIPWQYMIEEDEKVLSTEWHTISDDESLLGIRLSGRFFTPPNIKTKVQFLRNAGIEILNTSLDEFVTYRVTVNISKNGDLQSESRTVALALPDAPVLAGNRLMAYVHPEAVVNSETGDYHVQLRCGRFLKRGSDKSVSVVWRAERCVKNKLALRLGAHVQVDEVQARLMLLEGEAKGLRVKDTKTDAEFKKQDGARISLASRNESLASNLDNVQGELLAQNATDNQLISTVLSPEEEMSTQRSQESCTKMLPGAVSVWPGGIPAAIGERITFSVKACWTAILHLTKYPKTDSRYRDSKYRIELGITSAIKYYPDGAPTSPVETSHRHSHWPLDCDSFRRFYVSWDNGEVKVGTVEEPTGQAVTFNDAFLSYKPDDPIDVNYVNVIDFAFSTVWRFDDTVCPATTSFQSDLVKAFDEDGACVIKHPGAIPVWPDKIPSSIGTNFTFAIKSCGWAYLYLGKAPLFPHGAVVMMVIGNRGNNESSLAVGSEKVSHTHEYPPLDCASFRRFYVSWEGGEVKVGTVEDSQDLRYTFSDPFLSLKSSWPIEVANVFIASWYAPAEWWIDDPTGTCGGEA